MIALFKQKIVSEDEIKGAIMAQLQLVEDVLTDSQITIRNWCIHKSLGAVFGRLFANGCFEFSSFHWISTGFRADGFAADCYYQFRRHTLLDSGMVGKILATMVVDPDVRARAAGLVSEEELIGLMPEGSPTAKRESWSQFFGCALTVEAKADFNNHMTANTEEVKGGWDNALEEMLQGNEKTKIDEAGFKIPPLFRESVSFAFGLQVVEEALDFSS